MKRLIAAYLTTCAFLIAGWFLFMYGFVTSAEKLPGMLILGTGPGVTLGPGTWYDILPVASANNADANGSDQQLWSQVTVTTGGTATKMRIYCNVVNSSTGFKVALYNSTGSTLLASGTGTITATGETDVAFTSNASVTSSTTYMLYCVFQNNNAVNWQNTHTGGTLHLNTTGGAYAAAPPASVPTDQGPVTYQICLGVLVQ